MARHKFGTICGRRLLTQLALISLAVFLASCSSTGFPPIIDPLPSAPHPPMGWNGWYTFSSNISDSLVRQQADAMVANGMQQAGYEYVNLDDGWQGYRDSLGVLQPNTKFPDMKGLGDYLHSRGLKFGIYTSMGATSCTGLVGSYGHEWQDAQTFLDWGVDFVKLDLCGIKPSEQRAKAFVYQMSLALRKNEKHPVILSIVLLQSPWLWTQGLAVNMWRIALDEAGGYENILQIADADAPLAQYSGKEGWNDPDILRVGLGDMTSDEYRTHMTLWAMLSAPLLAGADLRSISPSDLAILTNPDVIAINQDAEAQQATRIQTGAINVWVKKLTVGEAVAVVNRSDQSMVFAVNPGELGVNATQAYEVWAKQIMALPHSITIAPHACVLLKIS